MNTGVLLGISLRESPVFMVYPFVNLVTETFCAMAIVRNRFPLTITCVERHVRIIMRRVKHVKLQGSAAYRA